MPIERLLSREFRKGLPARPDRVAELSLPLLPKEEVELLSAHAQGRFVGSRVSQGQLLQGQRGGPLLFLTPTKEPQL